MKYQNPIIPGFYPDPSIIRVDNKFYLVNSTFEYLPGVPIWESEDLIHWTQIGHCITRDSQINIRNCRCSGGIFAPTLRYNNGTFYMITTDIEKGTFILTNNDIYGEWSDPLLIQISGYDPSLFFDEDGQVYIQITQPDEKGLGIYQAKIDIVTGTLLTAPKLLWYGTGGRDPEGPHVYHINGYYYLLIAEGGTREGHMVTIARSKDIWGPYESCPHNPILTNREEPNISLQAIGHADFFQDTSGNWWTVGHCHRTLEHFFHHLGRETILIPFTWTTDGWPVIGTDGHIYPEMDGPIPPSKTYIPTLKDDFDSNKLDLQWNFMRSFLPKNYSLTSRPGWLHLTGTHITINDLDSPTYICRRQQHFNCSFKTKMNFEPNKSGQEAGLCIYYDNEHHMELAVTLIDNNPYLILRKNVADIKVVTNITALTPDFYIDNTIYLEIKATPTEYHFNYGNTEACANQLGFTVTKHLSTEAAYSDFVGVFCGMYTSSPDESDTTHAYFDYFTYTPQD